MCLDTFRCSFWDLKHFLGHNHFWKRLNVREFRPFQAPRQRMSFWFTCTPTHHQKLIPWRIYGVMVCAAASEATACSLLSRWWIEVWLILRTVSETQTACVHSTEVLYPITTGRSPCMHAHTNATHIRPGIPPSVPVVCLLLPDKAGFYVRKRLVSEPGVQSEPLVSSLYA